MNRCSMIKSPKIVCVFVYALDGNQGFAAKAANFAASYELNPPGMDHETLIVCNGVPANPESRALFNALPNVTFLDHDNSGWDIGAFQLAARTVDCDLMVFFGGHTYFRKPGWLARMWEAFQNFGDTLYGSTGNQGNIGVGVYPHVRTTAFWCSPGLLRDYPYRVTSVGGGGQRYEAEHGKTCLSNWVKQQGLTPWIVGWDLAMPLDQCDQIPGTYHQGDQFNVLVGDRMTCPPFHHCP